MGFRQRENEHLFSHPLTVVYIPVILDTEYAAQATLNTLRVSQLFSLAILFSIS